MSFKTFSLAIITATTLALPARADPVISVSDAYARVSSPVAKSGAAFLVIENTGDEADQLLGATSDIAKRVELHTHLSDADGNMQMRHVKEGFSIPAGGSHALERGGDHVMFMGLTNGLEHGDVVTVTLTFEKVGELTIEVPVDLERKAQHGGHKHGE
ncbi:copper chaperone PCu(A)C [Shimia abyssi]|uniref:Copper(I)-binding protein n=1 Tax=Shimia abyssi TaxID=1662395 RepID=A0A2P8F8V1_9RHOB|nr:copper chaperone PCu(A)C [Shimia abyssi]PSL18144.1 hypothetical protein CLV88_11268 [Shimia abyssi]